jgi:subtilisin-like proprotein convertase family protein
MREFLRLRSVFLFVLVFSLGMGSLPAQTFTGNGGVLNDTGQELLFPVEVSGLSQTGLDSSFGLVQVCIDLTHTWLADLDIQLVSPWGHSISLISAIGGDGDNFTGTCLSDTADANIAFSVAPFSGTFSPLDALGDLNYGNNPNGTWKLRVLDTYPGADTGELLSWSIGFGPNAGTGIRIDSTQLPILQIFTNGKVIVDEPKIMARLQISDKGNQQWNKPGDSANVYKGWCGIEIRGNFSSSLPQKPYSLETRDSLGENLDVSLLGMPKENDWILMAVYNDKAFSRNSLAYEISRKMGHYAARSRLVEVLIDGNYKGIYLLMEKLKRDNKRLNIAKLDPTSNSGDALTGGYIFKVDYHSPADSWLSAFHPIGYPAVDIHYVFDTPDPEVISPAQKSYIQNFMFELESRLYGNDFTNPQTGYRSRLDVGSFIDYFLVNELARNNDGFKKSYFFHKDRDSNGGLLKSGPVWDFDWAWKDINECSIVSSTSGAGWVYTVNSCNPDNYSPEWTTRLLQDSSFTRQLKCRFLEMRQTWMDTSFLFHHIDSIASRVASTQARHYKKWPILGRNVGTPELGEQPLTYLGEVRKLKDWILRRLNWLDNNMPGTCTTTGISNFPSSGMPGIRCFSDGLVHRWESDEPVEELQLIDAQGKCVWKQIIRQNSGLLPSVQMGIYLLRVKTQYGKIGSEKIWLKP